MNNQHEAINFNILCSSPKIQRAMLFIKYAKATEVNKTIQMEETPSFSDDDIRGDYDSITKTIVARVPGMPTDFTSNEQIVILFKIHFIPETKDSIVSVLTEESFTIQLTPVTNEGIMKMLPPDESFSGYLKVENQEFNHIFELEKTNIKQDQLLIEISDCNGKSNFAINDSLPTNKVDLRKSNLIKDNIKAVYVGGKHIIRVITSAAINRYFLTIWGVHIDGEDHNKCDINSGNTCKNLNHFSHYMVKYRPVIYEEYRRYTLSNKGQMNYSYINGDLILNVPKIIIDYKGNFTDLSPNDKSFEFNLVFNKNGSQKYLNSICSVVSYNKMVITAENNDQASTTTVQGSNLPTNSTISNTSYNTHNDFYQFRISNIQGGAYSFNILATNRFLKEELLYTPLEVVIESSNYVKGLYAGFGIIVGIFVGLLIYFLYTKFRKQPLQDITGPELVDGAGYKHKELDTNDNESPQKLNTIADERQGGNEFFPSPENFNKNDFEEDLKNRIFNLKSCEPERQNKMNFEKDNKQTDLNLKAIEYSKIKNEDNLNDNEGSNDIQDIEMKKHTNANFDKFSSISNKDYIDKYKLKLPKKEQKTFISSQSQKFVDMAKKKENKNSNFDGNNDKKGNSDKNDVESESIFSEDDNKTAIKKFVNSDDSISM